MIPRSLHALLLVLALSPLGARGGGGFPLYYPTAWEFVHETTGHYRLAHGYGSPTTSPGPGWNATGYRFELDPAWGGAHSDVCYFHNARSDSHFYTVVGAECDFLRQFAPEWDFKGFPFKAAPGKEDCGPDQPVYRLYNNSSRFNDANHRFTPDPGVRAKLIASGWADEGVALCTPYWSHEAIPWAIATNHLPPMPNSIEAKFPNFAPNPAYPRQAHAVTGLPDTQRPGLRIATAQPLADTGRILSHSFVQTDLAAFGIHVSGTDRLGGDYASINPEYRFAGRDFPFVGPRDPYLRLSFFLRIGTLNRADSESHAYGGPVLLFVDEVSGKSLYVAILAYGSIPLGDGPEAPGRDIHTGHVLVSTTFRAPSFGYRLAGTYLACPGDGSCSPAVTDFFSYTLDRAGFKVALDRARTLEPGLSADPSSFSFDSFQFRNETYRNAEVGVALYNFYLKFFTN